MFNYYFSFIIGIFSFEILFRYRFHSSVDIQINFRMYVLVATFRIVVASSLETW